VAKLPDDFVVSPKAYDVLVVLVRQSGAVGHEGTNLAGACLAPSSRLFEAKAISQCSRGSTAATAARRRHAGPPAYKIEKNRPLRSGYQLHSSWRKLKDIATLPRESIGNWTEHECCSSG